MSDRSRAFLYFLIHVFGCGCVRQSHPHFQIAPVDRRMRKVVARMQNLRRILGWRQDPYGEFFVVADASVPLEDLWNRHWADFEQGWHNVRFPCN